MLTLRGAVIIIMSKKTLVNAKAQYSKREG